MQNRDKYYTIENKERIEIKIKSSRFIATAIPVRSKEEAVLEKKKIAEEFYDANHNTFAYRIGSNGLEFRYSDDGEPNGTAGKPILFAIQKHNLSDIIIVVTRYFGGIKLGVGGLSRAYFESANSVLLQCKIKEVFKTIQVIIYTLYEDLAKVKRVVSEFSNSFTENFRDIVEIEALIPESMVSELEKKIVDVSKGRAGLKIIY